MPRKRAWQEMNGYETEELTITPTPVSEQLLKIRNMWEFASLMQYIFFFGKAVKIDSDLDIEQLEMECLNPAHSAKLSEIGLALLKFVSSHRGLTLDLFDEYTRRQYLAKAPERNPFGDEEEPSKFSDFDVFTKIRILHQLSTWTLYNPDRIRERMEEKDVEQTNWRIEPLGWDAQERSYFVLDDNRFYRMTDAPAPLVNTPVKSRSKSKKPRKKPSRVSRRIRASTTIFDSDNEEEEIDLPREEPELKDNGLNGAKWECLAVTLEEYQQFLDSLAKAKDPNEKALKKRIVDAVLPTIQKNAEEQERKILRKQRELENLQKLATAKRSGRIAGRMERQREMEEAAESERKRKEDLLMALKEQEKQRKIEAARESRMLTREQRLKDREVKRILHEEELSKLERSQSADLGDGRFSERHLKAEKEKRQKELEKLSEEDDEWYFDCAVCGVHGRNLDDGTQVMQCEKCNVWQHCACHKIGAEEAGRDDFHFICKSCLKPKPIKLKLTSSLIPNTDNNSKDAKKKISKSEPGINGNHHHSSATDAPRAKPVVWVQARRPNSGHESSASPPRREYSYHEYPRLNGDHPMSPPRAESIQHYPSEHPDVLANNSRSPPSQHYNTAALVNGHYQPSTSQSQENHNIPTANLPRLPQMTPTNTQYNNARQFYYYTPISRALPSPTEARPPLTATQGNTDTRFSPHNSFHSTSHQRTTTAFAPTTSSHGPASSPAKNPSPPIQPHSIQTGSPQHQLHPQVSLPSPSPAESAPIAGKGLSPIKHDSPRALPADADARTLSSPQLESHRSQSTTLPPFSTFSQSIYSRASQAGTPVTLAHPTSRTPPPRASNSPIQSGNPSRSPGQVPHLLPGPTLSPSQGLWSRTPVEPPVKKPMAMEVHRPSQTSLTELRPAAPTFASIPIASTVPLPTTVKIPVPAAAHLEATVAAPGSHETPHPPTEQEIPAVTEERRPFGAPLSPNGIGPGAPSIQALGPSGYSASMPTSAAAPPVIATSGTSSSSNRGENDGAR